MPVPTARILMLSALLGAATSCRAAEPRPAPAPATAERADGWAATAGPTTMPSPSTPAARATTTRDALERLGGVPCLDSDYTCIRLTVPRDHVAPDGGATAEVVFGVLPAGGERRGLLVTAVGGPGVSGLAVAQSYTEALDPELLEIFDLVFFDQRGVGRSGGVACPEAAAAYYRAPWLGDTPAEEAATMAAARAFARDCALEVGDDEALAFAGTEQAVADLEAFRAAMGEEQLWLYGESYGTQLVQTYAARYGEHVAGMILDAPVDMALSMTEFLAEQARAHEALLVATLSACDADPGCAADVGGDALAAFDRLAEAVRRAPTGFSFPLPDGGRAERTLSAADVETATAGNLAGPVGRQLVQRAVAAAQRGDLVPFARLLYDYLLLDPATEEAVADPTFSDASYYAVECSDHALAGGSPEQRATWYIRQGDAIDQDLQRLGAAFYGDLACAFWPGEGRRPPTAPAGRLAGIPTLVLTATGDPVTPPEQARRIARRLADGYLVTTQGGEHVTYGRGEDCPDALVNAFLLEGERPAAREVACEGDLVAAYVPLAPADASAFADPLAALAAVDAEIAQLPEYLSWDGQEALAIGCPAGGRLVLDAVDDVGRSALTLDACAFVTGLVLTGTGIDDGEIGTLTLDVGVGGIAEGDLYYHRDADGRFSIEGRYQGEPIRLSSDERRHP